jgi:hypothetical protein
MIMFDIKINIIVIAKSIARAIINIFIEFTQLLIKLSKV